MKIVLLNGYFGQPKIAEPMAICHLSAYLKSHGYEVTLIDPLLDGLSVSDVIELIIKQSPPDFLGISVHHDLMKAPVLEFLESIRRAGFDKFICLGGQAPTNGIYYENQYCTEYTVPSYSELGKYANAVVLGEGEETLLELLRCLERKGNWQALSGIAFLENSQFIINKTDRKLLEVDELPFLDRSILLKYKEKYNVPIAASINLGRGCPYTCSFCSIPAYQKNQAAPVFRQRSNNNVIDEILSLNREYGITHFNFEDDSFLVKNKKQNRKIQNLVNAFSSLPFYISFTIYLRIDTINPGLLSDLKKAGLTGVYIGIENVSQEALDFFQKDLSVHTIEQSMKCLENYGFSASVGGKLRIMVGYINFFPTVTIDMLRNSYLFVCKYNVSPKILIRRLRLYTGARIREKIDQLQLLSKSAKGWKYTDSRIEDIENIVLGFYSRTFGLRDRIRTAEKYIERAGIISEDIIFFRKVRKKLDELFLTFYSTTLDLAETVEIADLKREIEKHYRHHLGNWQKTVDQTNIAHSIEIFSERYKLKSEDLFRK